MGEEEWRFVVGWEGLYEVSSFGRVKSLSRPINYVDGITGDSRVRFLSERILKQQMTTTGYYCLGLHRDGVSTNARVHRLVCEAFHGPPPAGSVSAHANGNCLDNRASNLRWSTYSENMADARRHGTLALGERQGSSKLTAEDISAIRAARGSTQQDLADQYGVVQSCIANIRAYRRWRHLT